MVNQLLIGIDPGRNTGFAAYNPDKRSLTLRTLKIHQAFEQVNELNKFFHLTVVIEDPNLWTHFSVKDKKARARLQGAGSVKRDYSAWVDFLKDRGIPYRAVRPDKNRNAYAYDKQLFQKITGYTETCSEHARVAAMLVWK